MCPGRWSGVKELRMREDSHKPILKPQPSGALRVKCSIREFVVSLVLRKVAMGTLYSSRILLFIRFCIMMDYLRRIVIDRCTIV